MPSARGLVKCDGSRLVGTFDIDGSPRYLAVEVKPFDQSFECNNPTLIYNDVVQLVGDCKWTGTAGRDDLQMNFGGGVSIAGPLATPRSAIRIRGTGTWSTDPPIPANRMQDDVVSVNPSPPHDAVRDAAKVAREQQLLESCVPIIAYARGPPLYEFWTTKSPVVYLDSLARANQLCAATGLCYARCD